jgi:endoglucanase
MSLFWSQWMSKYWKEPFLSNFIRAWNLPIIRAPMGVEYGGYLQNSIQEISKIHTAIRSAIENGIYIIVDWHDHHAPDHLHEAKEFFSEIATTYKGYPNIIYEIFNEPLKVSWSDYVKPYAESIITAIRKYDEKNIIITGTPSWDQDVDIAAQDPIPGDNIAYTLHFYATSHRSKYREKASRALESGVALFVTEWGSCHADGGGEISFDETEKWIQFMEENYLSWCQWSICDKQETSAIFMKEPDLSYGINDLCLSESGRLIKSILCQTSPKIEEALCKRAIAEES